MDTDSRYETRIIVESGASDALVTETPQSMSLSTWIGFLLPFVTLGIFVYLSIRLPRIVASIWKFYEEDREESRPDASLALPPLPLSATPCQHCRFFTNNLYLNCAVHPTKVLTKQAIDCSDYAPCALEDKVSRNLPIRRDH